MITRNQSCHNLGEGFPDRKNSKCKVSGTGAGLPCLKNHVKARVAGPHIISERERHLRYSWGNRQAIARSSDFILRVKGSHLRGFREGGNTGLSS